jgi:hypothetical protein
LDVLDAQTVANIKSVSLETGFSLSHAAIMGNAARPVKSARQASPRRCPARVQFKSIKAGSWKEGRQAATLTLPPIPAPTLASDGGAPAPKRVSTEFFPESMLDLRTEVATCCWVLPA